MESFKIEIWKMVNKKLLVKFERIIGKENDEEK